MAIIKNQRNELLQQQILQANNEIAERRMLIDQLEMSKRIPFDWYEQTLIRIKLNNESIAYISKNYPDLLNYFLSNEITAEDCGDVTFVYVNQILPEHQAILTEAGATIENNE